MSTVIHDDVPAAAEHHHGKRDRAARLTTQGKPRTGRYLLLGIGLWLFLGLVLDHLFHNQIVRGGWIVLGAALVPTALVYAMAHRLRVTDTLSVATLVKAFIVGGFFAFTIGATFDTLVSILAPGTDGGPSLISYALSGIVEEASKAALVIFIGWKVAKTVRNGLFLGGAVGAGFALFETIGYIDYAPTMLGGNPAAVDGELFQAITAVERAITMPVGHPLWAALLGAAIFAAASQTGKFRITPLVVLAYLGVAFLHGMWDSGRVILMDLVPNKEIAGLAALPLELVLGLVGGLIWLRVVRHANKLEASRIEEAPVA